MLSTYRQGILTKTFLGSIARNFLVPSAAKSIQHPKNTLIVFKDGDAIAESSTITNHTLDQMAEKALSIMEEVGTELRRRMNRMEPADVARLERLFSRIADALESIAEAQ